MFWGFETHGQKNIKKQKMGKCQNMFSQQLIVLDGFSNNGYLIRNQRYILRGTACLNIDFRHFLNKKGSIILAALFG